MTWSTEPMQSIRRLLIRLWKNTPQACACSQVILWLKRSRAMMPRICCAISRLAELFDHMVIRVVEHQARAWLKILGSDITKLVILAHPVVDQIQYTEAMIQQSRKWLGQNCERLVVIDGYRKGATLKLRTSRKILGWKQVSVCRLNGLIDWTPLMRACR